MVKPRLSIIIVSYNTKELLTKCISSVYDQTRGVEFEIIMVDNNSQDGSEKEIQTRFPQVKMIVNEINKGFAAASNQGLKIMIGEYALLLNPDTIIIDNALAKMINFMQKHDEVGILCPKIFEPNGSLQRAAFPPPSTLQFLLSRMDKKGLFSGRLRIFYRRFIDPLLPAKLSNGYYDQLSRTSGKPFKAGWVSGACLMIRREVIEAIGFLDENLFLFCEDRDWCYRAREKNWDVMLLPEAQIIHYGGQSTQQNLPRGIPLYHRAQFYFVGKHLGRPALLALKFLVFWELLAKIFIRGFDFILSKGRRKSKLYAYMESLRLIFKSSKRIRPGTYM
jgi:GT2 family glycosyltransferase